ncbi:MAG: type II toxin-antitoxin system prevent-host-death family antitoxin [Chloroflexi bacterium]|nr:type II toxin-antitoxin system prevent-host-death family antitoxin [Chloroflexota bacterium]MBK7919402.1 type II toxin-antitoxin system prevent-host-death family antitoxin [Chloroflexota bacterium]
MVTVGVRELKQETSKILRRVREEGEIIEITYHGEVIARLVPVAPPEPTDEEIAAVWANLDQLTAEISAKWPEGVSAVDAIREVRREL